MDGLISPLDHWRIPPAFPAVVWILVQGLISAFIPLGFGEWKISLFLRLIQALTSLSDSYVRAWRSFITEISPKPIRGLDCCVSVLLVQQRTPPTSWLKAPFICWWRGNSGRACWERLISGSSDVSWDGLMRVEDAFPPWPSPHAWWVGIGSWLYQLRHWFLYEWPLPVAGLAQWSPAGWTSYMMAAHSPRGQTDISMPLPSPPSSSFLKKKPKPNF